ncbi:hypothetical protein [Collimonas humicola]|uniref:hypothetical protein n=1 Tax=Collimonas humicola TaxID=2825886 RepID=UPI001B8CDE42|nr:hypothetical protein [Collimonas humicola]
MRLDVLNAIERAALVELEKTTQGTIAQHVLDKLYSLGLAEDRAGTPCITGKGREFLMQSRYLGEVK